MSKKKYLFLILVFFAILNMSYLSKVLRVRVDEPWESITAYTLLTEGRLANPILEGRDGYEKHFLQPRIVQNILLVPFFKTLGFGLWQGRLLSVFFGLLTVIFTFLLTKKLFKAESIALLATLLVSVDSFVFVSARTIRPEIMVAALTVLAIYLFLVAVRKESDLLFSLLGIVIGIGLYTHPNMLLGTFSVLALFIYEYKTGILKQRGFWYFVLFSVLSFLPYAVYVVLEDWQNNFSDFWAQVGGRTEMLSKRCWLIESFKGEFARFAKYFFLPHRFLILVIVLLGFIAALIRQTKANVILVIIIVVHLASFWLLIENKTARYLTVLSPFFCILVAALVAEFLKAKGEKFSLSLFFSKLRVFNKRTVFATLIFMAFFLNQLFGDLALILKDKDSDYYGFIQKIEEIIPNQARVWGSMTFWMGLYNHPYRTQFTYLRDLETFKPEIMILDSYDLVRLTPEKYGGLVPKLKKLVDERGTLIGKVNDRYYGNIKIYKLNW